MATSWKDATRKAMVGPRVALKSVGGEVSVAPKKWSTATADAIADAQRRYTRENRDQLKAFRVLKDRLEAEGKTLEGADPLELIEATPAASEKFRVEIYRLALADGIGEHDFGDEEGKLIGEGRSLDAKTIEEIISWDPLATEIFAVISEYNRPLPQGSAPTSQT